MNQPQGFNEATEAPTTNVGNMITELANNTAANGVQALVQYGDINQAALDNELISENIVVDPTVRGYLFSKMTLYYLLKYATAVNKLHIKNPIRARVLALVSAISFYMQNCSRMSLESVLRNADGGQGNFVAESAVNDESLMAKTNRTLVDVGNDFGEDRPEMREIDRFLKNSILRYKTRDEKVAVKAFGKLQNAFKKLGETCAVRANRLFRDATPLMMKQYPSNKRFPSARHQTLTGTGAAITHVNCNEKFKLLRRYIFYYHEVSTGIKDPKINLISIRFGDDHYFEHAVEATRIIAYENSFWWICRNDLRLLDFESPIIKNINQLGLHSEGREIEQELDDAIKDHVQVHISNNS